MNKGFKSSENVKNILLYFYCKEKSKPIKEVNAEFTPIAIDHSDEIEGNRIPLA
jgi:hypothetical protein